ncbi:MAG: peptidoglycan-binding protein [Cyanobacteria bacterium P01_F01_bin.53]
MVNTQIATPTLQLGATGAAVKDLQELLLKKVNIGGLTADGDFGPITQLAVQVFQLRSFLANDGIVGPSTWNVLLNGGVKHLATLRRGSQGPLVERLQQAMSLGSKTGPLNDIQEAVGTRGYYFGTIDGDFGPMTEQAVKAYQQAPFGQTQLSTIDGIVGPNTWTALTALITRTSHVGL